MPDVLSTSYSITYSLDGGKLSGLKTNPSKYTPSSSAITLNNPTKDGYTFVGWTGTGLSNPTTTVTIPSGSHGKRRYIANWSTSSSSGGSSGSGDVTI